MRGLPACMKARPRRAPRSHSPHRADTNSVGVLERAKRVAPDGRYVAPASCLGREAVYILVGDHGTDCVAKAQSEREPRVRMVGTYHGGGKLHGLIRQDGPHELGDERFPNAREAGDFAPQGPRDLDDPRSLIPR